MSAGVLVLGDDDEFVQFDTVLCGIDVDHELVVAMEIRDVDDVTCRAGVLEHVPAVPPAVHLLRHERVQQLAVVRQRDAVRGAVVRVHEVRDVQPHVAGNVKLFNAQIEGHHTQPMPNVSCYV